MAPLPLPLLTLRLSSPSFLETILTHDGLPVYSTETYHNATSLSRCDAVHGLVPVANVCWPDHAAKGKAKELSGAHVFINGTEVAEDDLLRRNVLNTSRKFHIPGHSHALKWKRVQGVFQCTSAAGTLVAVFEPAILTARARLNVFIPSLPGLPDSTILTDYIIVTSLLLFTHPEDWRGLPTPTVSPISSQSTSPVSPISCTCLDAHDLEPKELVVVGEYEPPPPYEEIQWTVRVPQPRRHRHT